MKEFFRNVLANVVALVLYTLVFFFLMIGIAGIFASLGGGNQPVVVKPNSVLQLSFSSEISDRGNSNSFDLSTLLSDEQPSAGLNDILKSIENAKTDNNIKCIFIDGEDVPAGLSTIDEIREAIIDFKTSGKPVYAYGNNMSQSGYYLSSVADKIVVNPLGEFVFKGLCAEITFYKGLLDKLGVEVQVFRHGKFKSAVEPYLLTKMSDANRLQYQAMLDAMWSKYIANVSKSRNIDVVRLNEIADGCLSQDPFNALKLGLIDSVAYREDMLADLASLVGVADTKDLNLISIKKYAKSVKSPINMKNKIAVVYASGEINRTSSSYATEPEITEKAFVEALKEVRNDSTIKAVVLRVNSPGGDAQTSDVIWREVELTKQVKPVIVSMGEYAASGGYYISCPATRILANEFTLTGSIGVFGVMLNVQKLMENKLGLTSDVVVTNKMSDIGNSMRKMSPAEREIIQSSVESIYGTFVNRVSNGRNMSPESVDSIGQGRVWCGADAIRIGLIDDFGGLTKAIAVASEMAGIDSYSIVDYPKQEDPFESMLKSLTEEACVRRINAEFGELAEPVSQIKSIIESQGVQARMENIIEIY